MTDQFCRSKPRLRQRWIMTDIEIPDGFTRWDGGDCPVSDDDVVEYVLRKGAVAEGKAGHLFWYHGEAYWQDEDCEGQEIIAYRIVS